ncbi:hypothetical protein CEUSTIGMA_g3246.t1 [Chlamydomonas eustigma]|uniref:glutamate--tRNA ligase n=1 Tax=Chlamydomonas eustigma TaxID=1157962 RepID=A0A250WY84_9CHLO|nr:hypothetical protein CEUSTIGMA_g3246.t1 [Chlamydomonas eustigma]|eukprot:GAX75803.1 hypothetical protein CEUSTIGMA_g3246.t1 [Chlamydomonas eustigma]
MKLSSGSIKSFGHATRTVYMAVPNFFKPAYLCQRSRRSELRCVASAVAEAEVADKSVPSGADRPVRVRFAPSPTGNLHVGGARTALFNWLYAKKTGGKFILRVEDTDEARSTRASEDAMIRDLKWLGLNWDEGPDVGGPFGPYRQSERTAIYKQYAEQLVNEGHAYPCFCTDEELEQMKKDAEEKKLPPIYRGKWASASKEEVEAMKATGASYCYRFRVPKSQNVTIQDTIRGEVTWSSDTLGDFVLLRSSGLPVYNFCVAIDDCLMGITHVIRAEEHLPNTLRQVLIYDALKFPRPIFAHVSLILAPDKSKLSKRHGATSVGEFQTQGFLAPAMVNFLALLGWNDGTEQEIFSVPELSDRFNLERITKSPAVFDKVKLSWMNGQHLRSMGEEKVMSMVAAKAVELGLFKDAESPFAKAVVKLIGVNLELVADAEVLIRNFLAYPLEETLSSEDAKPFVEDNLREVIEAVVAAADSGELETSVKGGHDAFKAWINGVGKAQKRKGKRLFMPMRIALTGRMQGSEVGEQMEALLMADGQVPEGVQFTSFKERIAMLKTWLQTPQ